MAEVSTPLDQATVPIMDRVILTVNGIDYAMEVDSRMTLLDALREKCGLTGSKKGCDHGQCGACTIHIGGRTTVELPDAYRRCSEAGDHDYRRTGTGEPTPPTAAGLH